MSITAVYTHLLNFLYREQSCIRDKVYGAVGHRTVVMPALTQTATNPNPLAVRRQSACILPCSHRLTIYRDNNISRFYLIPVTSYPI